MSATTTDRATSRKEGVMGICGMAAVAILAGTLVCYNSSGYLTGGADTSGYTFAGVAYKAVDNSTGSAGDLTGEFYRRGAYQFASAALSADDVGKPVYLLDNQTVVLSGHASLTQHIYVGRITEVLSATSCYVDIRPGEKDPNLVDAVVDVAGTNAAALNLSTPAASLATGGTEIYVKAVLAVWAFATSGGASAGRKVVTTNYTLSGGTITTVTDESANRLYISLRGVIKQ